MIMSDFALGLFNSFFGEFGVLVETKLLIFVLNDGGCCNNSVFFSSGRI